MLGYPITMPFIGITNRIQNFSTMHNQTTIYFIADKLFGSTICVPVLDI